MEDSELLREARVIFDQFGKTPIQMMAEKSRLEGELIGALKIHSHTGVSDEVPEAINKRIKELENKQP